MASEYIVAVAAVAAGAAVVAAASAVEAVPPSGADANERSPPRNSRSARTPLPTLAPCISR